MHPRSGGVFPHCRTNQRLGLRFSHPSRLRHKEHFPLSVLMEGASRIYECMCHRKSTKANVFQTGNLLESQAQSTSYRKLCSFQARIASITALAGHPSMPSALRPVIHSSRPSRCLQLPPTIFHFGCYQFSPHRQHTWFTLSGRHCEIWSRSFRALRSGSESPDLVRQKIRGRIEIQINASTVRQTDVGLMFHQDKSSDEVGTNFITQDNSIDSHAKSLRTTKAVTKSSSGGCFSS